MKIALHWQILISLVLGGLAGWLGGEDAQLFGVQLTGVYDFVGTLFLNGLKMLIVPLVFATLVVGVASISPAKLGRLAWKAIVLYYVTAAIAVCIGLLLANITGIGTGTSDAACISGFQIVYRIKIKCTGCINF